MSHRFSAANLTFSSDMVALMEALGQQLFAMYGFDTGMPIAYTLTTDHSTDLTVCSSHSTNLLADACPKEEGD